MGRCGPLGSYIETMITTDKPDASEETDNQPVFCDLLIGLLVAPLALAMLGLMGLFVWAYIGLIIPIVIIGLVFWACGHYGSNHSILAGWRYRLTMRRQRPIPRRRLLGPTLHRRLSDHRHI